MIRRESTGRKHAQADITKRRADKIYDVKNKLQEASYHVWLGLQVTDRLTKVLWIRKIYNFDSTQVRRSNNCCLRPYIGQTGRSIECRLQGHRRDVELLDSFFKKPYAVLFTTN